MISNSGHDERGKYSGGMPGDQTKTEWAVINWYNRPWNVVLRYPNADVGKSIANNAYKAANNDHIGYNQNVRTTFWKELSKVGYDPARITTNCDADCTAGATACVKAAGYQHNIAKLKNLSPDIYSGNMKTAFKNAGFQVLTASKYLTSDDYLLPGDVLLYEGHHAATNLSTGKKAVNESTGSTTTYPCWVESNGSWYYRTAEGQNAHGWTKVKEVWYYLDPVTGAMKTGWLKDGNKWYYLTESGAMAANTWVKDKDDWYWVTSDGSMATNFWLQYKSEWYYLGEDGKMYHDKWIQYKGQWYWLNSDGVMVKNTWLEYKGDWYWLDNNGIMLENDWIQYKNEWYYIGEEGKMYKSKWIQRKSGWYYLSENGVMATNAYCPKDGKYAWVDKDGVWNGVYVPEDKIGDHKVVK